MCQTAQNHYLKLTWWQLVLRNESLATLCTDCRSIAYASVRRSTVHKAHYIEKRLEYSVRMYFQEQVVYKY